MPFCSLNRVADRPLEIFPPDACFLARRFWFMTRRISGFACDHAALYALNFSGFAAYLAFMRPGFGAPLDALCFSGFAFTHAALFALFRSGLAFAQATDTALFFSVSRAHLRHH